MKTVEEKAIEHGKEKANPVIRSMYPHMSRGEAAREFAHSYQIGHAEGFQEALRLLRKEVCPNDPKVADYLETKGKELGVV